MEIVNKFPILCALDPKILKNLKQAYVFGKGGRDAVIATKDGAFYRLWFGKMNKDAVGSKACPSGSQVLMSRFEYDFWKFKSADAAFGMLKTGDRHDVRYHVIVSAEGSSDQRFYVWGNDAHYQLGLLGNPHDRWQVVPESELVSNRNQGLAHSVTKVVCSARCTMLLTSKGQVWACGMYSWLQQKRMHLSSDSMANSRKIIDIACGQNFALAVSADGEVWGWGANKQGQVGIGKETRKVPSPTRILFDDDGPKIRKIACGSKHGLAVSETGVLYTWGDDSHGQLGNGTTTSSNSPRKIVLDSNNYAQLIATGDKATTKVAMANINICVLDVAGHATQDLSLALTQHNQVFMWGNCRGVNILQPVKMLRNFKDLDSAFVACSTEPIMLRPITISADEQAGGSISSGSQGASVLNALRKAFDDPETSDMKFMIEEKPLHVHKSVLAIRSEYFRKMFSSEWKEAKEGVVKIPDIAYDVYKAYLMYLYTGELDVDVKNAINLANLAQSHLQEDLVSMCVEIIREGITIDNAVEVWDEAIRASAKDIEEMCLKYLTNNLTSAINSGLLDKLGEDRVKEFFEKAAKAGALP